MLTGIKMAFVGGDARQLEIIQHAIELDATAVLIGFDEWNFESAYSIRSDLTVDVLKDIDALVLPVAGCDDQGMISAHYSTDEIRLTEEHFAALPRQCQVFTGIARNWLTDMCKKYGLRLIKLMELDEVAISNSIPTAEGAIKMAMEHTDITIHGSKTVVLGFGRCGVTLARVAAALGAKVKVGARKDADLARIYEMGLEPFHLSEIMKNLQEAEVIFNTIPAPILTAEVLARVPKTSVIIDIASAPGGTDFRYAEKRGIKAFLAPSLPGIVAPKTAGQIIARSLCRMLWEHA
ncbi:dipicolinate synthase subunit A [Collibacillus ludicampi]|uniref:Dipicolinate synthase subunit A n=1 Tax=Collibacillus ludicampi TaxID=2771369 RepID=A0AAV4LJ94_9BACL|nr:dipicolinate synthase subunit DpsA [Collibacillus ludicampi]GIM47855.1 dipicolinate synthase subunit A [Collibacillus ludicampi]